MPILLHIDSSPMGEDSISRYLTREFVDRWRRVHPEGEVISRDLNSTFIPAIDAEWISANLAPAESRTEQQNGLLALSNRFTTELLKADEYVIGVPMHNWGPTASFKLWADQIVRFGQTIIATRSGPKGTLDKKRATFVVAAGRHYWDGRSTDGSYEHLQPWLRTLFGNLGVQNMHFILADGTAGVKYGSVDRAAFLVPHRDRVLSLFTECALD